VTRTTNALAETVLGLFKTEEIHRRGPGKGLEDVEFATLEWVAWYNGSRLLEPLGYVPPATQENRHEACIHWPDRSSSRSVRIDCDGADRQGHPWTRSRCAARQ
jgi:hypothetical protein